MQESLPNQLKYPKSKKTSNSIRSTAIVLTEDREAFQTMSETKAETRTDFMMFSMASGDKTASDSENHSDEEIDRFLVSAFEDHVAVEG